MAPTGTVARIAVAEVTVKLAAIPLKLTAVAPVKSVPLMVTLVAAGAVVGVKLVIVGGARHSGTHSECSRLSRWIRESTRKRA